MWIIKNQFFKTYLPYVVFILNIFIFIYYLLSSYLFASKPSTQNIKSIL
jgi:hypothetical protein